MATDYVVRLTGDNSNLQNALAQTRKALADTGQASGKLEDIQKRFDKITNSSAPLGKKIADIRKAMEQMAVTGEHTTEEGKKMWEQLSQAAKEYDAMLRQVRQDTSSVPDLDKGKKGGGGIDLKSLGGDLADKAGLGGVTKSLGGLAAMANPATIAITATAGTMIAAGKAASEFENHLDDLQALTKVTDKEIAAMGDTSLALSKKFGTSAGSIVDSMGVIGSQAPELLKDAEALSFVTDAAMTLGKAGSISAEAAASAITTVMNQMGVAGSEALNIANTLEAAEQQGSASVEYLNKAIEKSGTMAKQAGMSYVDLASMIETVAPKFSSADVAGSQLNSTLLALTQAEDQYNPAILGVTQALENLNAAHLSTAELSKLVGASNIVMVNAMMEGVDTFNAFQDSIDGTNAAVEAWQVKTNNMTGAIDKLKATWDAFLIKLGQSGLIQGIADNIMMVMEALGEVIDVISDVISAFEDFGGEGGVEVNFLKDQLDFLISVIRAVGEVVTVVIKIFSKAFEYAKGIAGDCAEWIGEKWDSLKKNLGDVAFVRVIVNAFEAIMRKALEIIGKVKKAWNDFKKFLGMKVETDVSANPGMTPSERKAQEQQQREQIANDTRARNAEAASRASSSSKGGTKSGGGKKTATAKTDYITSVDDKSLDTAEKKLQAWQGKKKNLPITATAEIAEADAEIKKWTEEVQRRKLALTVEGAEGLRVVEDLEKQLNELRAKKVEVTTTTQGADKVDELNQSIAQLSDKSVTVTERTETDVSVSTSVEGADKVDELNQSIESLADREVNVTEQTDVNVSASVEGQESVEQLDKSIEQLADKSVTVTEQTDVSVSTSVEGADKVDELAASISELQGKEVTVAQTTEVSTSVEGADKVDELAASISELQGKEVTVAQTTEVSTSVEGADKVDELNQSIESLRDKSVTVTVEVEAPDEMVVPVSADTSTIDTEIKELERQILRQKIHLGIVPEVEVGSVNDLEAKIKKLEGEKKILLNTKADPEGIREIDGEIETLKQQFQAEKIRVGLAPDPNSLNGIKVQIKEKEKELGLLLNSDLDPEAIQQVVNELDELRKREKEKSIELGVTTAPTIAPKEEKMTKGSVADKRQSLSNANSIADQVKADYKVGLIGKEEAMAQLADLDNKLSELGIKPLELHVNDDGSITSAIDELEKYKEQMQSTADIIGSMGDTFGSLGSAIGGSAGEVMNFAGQTLNTISQILPQIVGLITAKQAEAMASGTASAAALPFPANIAAMASIIATVASLFAQIPKFETGGIVGGSSYHGDKLLARVNSGEMILNQAQQKNLANTLGAVGAQGGGGVGGDVRFHISGTALKGTLRNHDKKTSRIK